MDRIRTWTDPRDHRVWKVRAYWAGQAMAVNNDPKGGRAHPAQRRIQFLPVDGRGPLYSMGMGEDEREIEELLDWARRVH